MGPDHSPTPASSDPIPSPSPHDPYLLQPPLAPHLEVRISQWRGSRGGRTGTGPSSLALTRSNNSFRRSMCQRLGRLIRLSWTRSAAPWVLSLAVSISFFNACFASWYCLLICTLWV